MPFGDGTGPFGEGPMTGRGMGYCSGNEAAGRFFGRGFGRGMGRGFGRGRGMGMGRRFVRGFGRMPFDASFDEKAALENRLKFLEEELTYTKERLKEVGEEKD